MTAVPPTELFGREVVLVIGNLEIRNLRVEFNVAKSANPQPNRADIKVYNLSPTHRSFIESHELQNVVLLAGYKGSAEQIFTGQMARAIHANDGTDWVTHLKVGDGLAIARALPTGDSATNTTAKARMEKALADAGAGKGNFDQFMSLKDPKKLERYSSMKNAQKRLEEFAATYDAEFSIQDGQPQFTDRKGLASLDIVSLSARTGMLGSPELGKKGLIKVRSLIQNRFRTGHGVELKARQTKGIFKIETVTFTGDTHGEPWYADLELVEIEL